MKRRMQRAAPRFGVYVKVKGKMRLFSVHSTKAAAVRMAARLKRRR